MTVHIVLGGDENTLHTTAVDVEHPQIEPIDPKYMGSVADKDEMSTMGRPQALLVRWA